MAEAAIIATIASAGLDIIGGIQANKQADREAENARADAEEKAQDRIRDTKRARSRQLVGFLKSGVELEGTPFDILDETVEIGAKDVSSIRRTGAAQADSFKAVGRQKFIGSLAGATNTLGKGFFS